MNSAEPTQGKDSEPDSIELVCAIGHEVGNHLGGIRLQAHFLDEDLDARALATASVEIDTLAGRAAPLLALLRPILAGPEPPTAAGIQWGPLLGQLRQRLDDEGTRGVPVTIEESKGESIESRAVEGFQNLVYALVSATLDRLDASHSLRLDAEAREDGSVLVVSDDGAAEDLSGEGGLRGRSLVLAIARRLLGGVGGRVETFVREDSTRIELIVPNRQG